MLISIFPCEKTTVEDVKVYAEKLGDMAKVMISYPGTNCEQVSVTFTFPANAVAMVSLTENADEISFKSSYDVNASSYVTITLFGSYIGPARQRAIFEKIYNEIKSRLAPEDYLISLARDILKELKSKDTPTRDDIKRIERIFGWLMSERRVSREE